MVAPPFVGVGVGVGKGLGVTFGSGNLKSGIGIWGAIGTGEANPTVVDKVNTTCVLGDV